MTADDIRANVSVCLACKRVGGRNRGSKNDFRVFSCESCAMCARMKGPASEKGSVASEGA